MTLPPATVARVKALLERHCGDRQIAKLLDHEVSKGTVAKIRLGKYEPHATAAGENEPEIPPHLVEKCPRCHYLVLMPCQICRARDYRHRRIQLRRRMKRKPKPD